MSDEPKTLADWDAMHKPITMKMVFGGNNPANLDDADAVIFKSGRNGVAIFDPAYVKWLVENSNAGLLDEYYTKPSKFLSDVLFFSGAVIALVSAKIFFAKPEPSFSFAVLNMLVFASGCWLIQESGGIKGLKKRIR